MAARAWTDALRAWGCGLLCAAAAACGGGHGSGFTPGVPGGGGEPAGANVADVVADGGPHGDSVNTLFTTVTVCVPGTSTCQTIDHIEVDTASYGLRLLAPVLTVNLPLQQAADGNSLAECLVFADGYSWGPVAAADVQISGETASAVPVHLIGDSRFGSIPTDCSGAAALEEDTVATFGANGILGIGVFAQDCGAGCAAKALPASYYSCSATQCVATTVALADQVANPVTLFATDNNGTILELPSVVQQGAPTLTGSLIFGIDTQSNNASGTQTILPLDPDFGYLTVNFDSSSYASSFIDTGSNGTYFNDSNILQCPMSGFAGFYCPPTTLALTATLQGNDGTTAGVSFNVGNAQLMNSSSPTFTVLPELAGPITVSGAFDFGLPFYFGRRVATAIETETTSVGTGPYIAF